MTDSHRKEIIEVINSELKKFAKDSLDAEMKKILQRSSSQSRKELVDSIKNALEAAFKILWIKRDFWKTDIR